MDEVTTKMCVTRIGRIGFDSVLVEIDAEKGIKDKIEIMNKSKNVVEEGSTSVGNSNGKGMLGSNRFTLLDSLVNEEELTPTIDQRKIVDKFLSNKSTAKNIEMNGWSEDMKRYYRDKKELFDAAQEMEKNEDVLDENFGVENVVLRNEAEGIGRDILN
ncbi:hypothetical protein Tco_1374119 [Tanacetum coccineum]